MRGCPYAMELSKAHCGSDANGDGDFQVIRRAIELDARLPIVVRLLNSGIENLRLSKFSSPNLIVRSQTVFARDGHYPR